MCEPNPVLLVSTQMPPFDLPLLRRLGEAEVAAFRRDGFLVVERLLSAERVAALQERFPRLFAGKFDIGVYLDEWYWREGMSLPDVTRHMANAWKSDLTWPNWCCPPISSPQRDWPDGQPSRGHHLRGPQMKSISCTRTLVWTS
jgi:hypothetical protein